VIADGCHLDRSIKALIEHEFEAVKLEQFQALLNSGMNG
jgi:hypothetical protein